MLPGGHAGLRVSASAPGSSVGIECFNICMASHEPRVPTVDLDRVDAVQFQFYDHTVGAYLVTDDDDMARWIDEFASRPPATIAADIETRGLDTAKYSITAVTVAFHLGGDTVALLFDPLRRNHHRSLLARVFDHAERIVFHGGSFDIAPLYAHRLMTRAHIRKIGDTLVAARMINTNNKAGRSLEDLATAYSVMSDDRTTMDAVFASRGLKKNEGFWFTDIDCPTYVVGALSDTVATLRLWGTPGVSGDGIMAHAARYLTRPDVGVGGQGELAAADAERVVEDVQRVNQIVMERTARGYAVDAGFPDRFVADSHAATQEAGRLLAEKGVRVGNGNDLVQALVKSGDIDAALWPKSPTGQLKADKKSLEVFDEMEDGAQSPLVKAHQQVATAEKIHRYVTKVVDLSGPTGRLHPEIKILGACATGRMAASNPEIQQFPDIARGVIMADDQEWISADWKSIEPVVLATASGDSLFIEQMRQGADPYEPVGKLAGIDRKLAKRKMLADMYGQGHKAAALQFGWTLPRAKEVAYKIRDGLPILYQLIDALKQRSEENGHITTLSGRVLDQRFAFNDATGARLVDIAERVAPNHFCQGTALDVMHYAILELDRRGLSDHAHLWMHDEIVADACIAEELTEVMATPPPFLEAVAEYHRMDAFLAVDLNEVGQRWKSV
jgi:DNA polymerase I-like protein with 3'-5' exonuclease and polymerase domains